MVLDVTRRVAINTERPMVLSFLSINSPTLVRPNTDTLYSSLWPGRNLHATDGGHLRLPGAVGHLSHPSG
jgi:hypothetical protein